jgi:outer membrane lipoprotein SlyB
VLICEPVRHPTLLSQSERRFERKRTREIRLEHSDQTNGAVGAAVGGGIGTAVGASLSNPSLNREGGALLLGSIGAIAGGFLGRDFPLIHGKVIYKR